MLGSVKTQYKAERQDYIHVRCKPIVLFFSEVHLEVR